LQERYGTASLAEIFITTARKPGSSRRRRRSVLRPVGSGGGRGDAPAGLGRKKSSYIGGAGILAGHRGRCARSLITEKLAGLCAGGAVRDAVGLPGQLDITWGHYGMRIIGLDMEGEEPGRSRTEGATCMRGPSNGEDSITSRKNPPPKKRQEERPGFLRLRGPLAKRNHRPEVLSLAPALAKWGRRKCCRSLSGASGAFDVYDQTWTDVDASQDQDRLSSLLYKLAMPAPDESPRNSVRTR